MKKMQFCTISIVSIFVVFSVGCAGPQIASPNQLHAPSPIRNNSGKYMCPYTQDGVLAEWTDNAINAKTGSVIGKTAGAYLGQKACEQIPFVGGLVGGYVGQEVGRTVAVDASGGWEKIKNTSDTSFNSVNNMSVYLYVKHSSHEHYNDALQAAFAIYPEFQKAYYPALVRASKNVSR